MKSKIPHGTIDGFIPLRTRHCVTGSMWDIYHFNQYSISEEVLFGLGSGIGFAYMEMKGTIPFLGGRGNVGRQGEDGLEMTAAKRTGVAVRRYTTSSVKKAERRLLELLSQSIPIMLYADMGFLPYLHLPPGTHFGAHMVVVAGYQPEASQVFIADRDGLLHPVLLSDLAQARNSRFKPFPPKNTWFEFDFSHAHPIDEIDIRLAIKETSEKMLYPPISSLGVKGIYKAAQRIPHWVEFLGKHDLQAAASSGYIYIDSIGGTGGGLFRYMYSDFLHESVQNTRIDALDEISYQFKFIGDRWQEIALLFKQFSPLKNPKESLCEIGDKLQAIAELEEIAWKQLFKTIKQ